VAQCKDIGAVPLAKATSDLGRVTASSKINANELTLHDVSNTRGGPNVANLSGPHADALEMEDLSSATLG
jgi:enterochelin esterase-like enzyme